MAIEVSCKGDTTALYSLIERDILMLQICAF
jgi:hypothetical protein